MNAGMNSSHSVPSKGTTNSMETSASSDDVTVTEVEQLSSINNFVKEA